jgi:hypothetical protein
VQKYTVKQAKITKIWATLQFCLSAWSSEGNSLPA